MDGWNTILSFWVSAYFQVLKPVSFREGMGYQDPFQIQNHTNFAMGFSCFFTPRHGWCRFRHFQDFNDLLRILHGLNSGAKKTNLQIKTDPGSKRGGEINLPIFLRKLGGFHVVSQLLCQISSPQQDLWGFW